MEKNNKSENFPEEISSKYEIIQEIGRGAFSIVYKVKSKSDNNIYCLKKINMKKTKDKENEINILSNLDHPNLIKFFYSFSNDEGIYIIMEFCEYGDLFSLLQSVKKKKVYVNEEIIWNVAIQTLLGLEYLHSKQIIHRDIKLLNLFMTKDKKIKIGDMGMSKHVEEGEMIMSRVGTPLYIAPELVKKEKYDYKIDIWSFGCSLYHLAKTSPPFNDENLIKLGNSIINEQPAHLPSCYSDKLYEFILLLMTKNKNKRPSANEALKLVPEKIRNKLNNIIDDKLKNNNDNNDNTSINNNSINNIKRNIISENKKLSEDESLSNNNINESNKDNNKKDLKIYSQWHNKDFFGVKNNENLNINKGLVSGQTFYHFFKNNPEKKKNNIYFGVNNSELNNNKNQNILVETKNNTKNNHKHNNGPNLMLSKTMLQIKEHFNRIKIPENLNIEENNTNKIIDNNKINEKNNLNSVKKISQSYDILKKNMEMTNIEEEKKEENILNNYEEINLNINEENDEKNQKTNNNYQISRNKNNHNINNSNKSENIRYNLKAFNKSIDNKNDSNNKNDIIIKYNRKELMNKYLNKQNNIKEKGGVFNLYSKNINTAMKTFLINENKNNKKGILNSMQLNNHNNNIINNNLIMKKNSFNRDKINYNIDNNKEEIIFPLIFQPEHKIQNKYKDKNNSTTNKHKKYPELYNNFRKTVNSKNFRNKLTIHDLK